MPLLSSVPARRPHPITPCGDPSACRGSTIARPRAIGIVQPPAQHFLGLLQHLGGRGRVVGQIGALPRGGSQVKEERASDRKSRPGPYESDDDESEKQDNKGISGEEEQHARLAAPRRFTRAMSMMATRHNSTR